MNDDKINATENKTVGTNSGKDNSPPSNPQAKRKAWKMKVKTYGVRHLMEWQLTLPTGYEVRPYITVNFTGGQISGYGVAPARFTTADPFVQALIESTKWYEQGLIIKLREE